MWQDATMTLSDIGERAIIRDVLGERYSRVHDFGNDCASFSIPFGVQLVATTDPCPVPAASLAGFDDYYYWGWLLSTINLSDLAAAGATPVGMLTSISVPGDFLVRDLVRILDGIDECCARVGCAVVGGNLREFKSVDLSATAFGSCEGEALRRSGAKPDDLVLLFGPTGDFWSAFLAIRGGLSMPEDLLASCRKALLTPTPQVALGRALREAGLPTASMDNSDGLFASLEILSQVNRVSIELDLDSWVTREAADWVASELGFESQRLALGWGDWQLVVTVDPSDSEAALTLGETLGVFGMIVGRVVDGSGVVASMGGRRGKLLALDSQRFTKDSWFTAGIDSYVSQLTTGRLVN